MPDEASLLNVARWEPGSGEQLGYRLSINSGWLIYSYEVEWDGLVRIDSLFYGVGGYVALKFENKRLASVSLGTGYLGALPGGITIGAKMANVVSVFGALEYDDLEELYYPAGLNEGGVIFEFDAEDNLMSVVVEKSDRFILRKTLLNWPVKVGVGPAMSTQGLIPMC